MPQGYLCIRGNKNDLNRIIVKEKNNLSMKPNCKTALKDKSNLDNTKVEQSIKWLWTIILYYIYIYSVANIFQ